MRRAIVPWMAIILVLGLSQAALATPSTIVLAIEGMT